MEKKNLRTSSIRGERNDRLDLLLGNQYEHRGFIYGADSHAHKKAKVHSSQGVCIPVDYTFSSNGRSGRHQQSVQPDDIGFQIYDKNGNGLSAFR